MLQFKTLQTKMLVSFILLVLIPVIGLGSFSYYIATRFLEKQTMQNQVQIIRLIADNIKHMLDDATDLSSFIVGNETIQSMLSQTAPSYIGDPQKTIFNYLSNLKQAKKYISFIVLYGENDFMFKDFSEFFRQVVPYEEFKESPLYMATAARNGQSHLDYSGSPLFIYAHNYNDIVLGRRILSLYDADKKLGMFFLGINRDAIRDAIQDVQISRTTNLLLFDDNYRLVASKLDDKEMSKHFKDNVNGIKNLLQPNQTWIYEIGNKKYLAANTSIELYRWHIVSLTPMDDIQKQYSIVLSSTIILSFSLLLVAIVMSILLSKGITLPIKKLLRSMNNFKRGDFNQKVPVESKDEIGLLTQKYNEMVAQLNELIQKVYISQTNQKMIELKTLQAQIEPHFLYNTLDYIFFSSKINGDNQTAKVVQSLSELFRLSLNKGEDYYKLENEMNQIKAYINIQHARFPSRFTPIYHIDSTIGHFITLKLLLQPIVENAILHAFEPPTDRQGVLLIGSYVQERDVVWIVQDNGNGMNPDQVEQLLYIPVRSKGGYGLRNVNERLQMMFGPEYALQINSIPEIGTTVIVRIPIIENETQWGKLYESHGH
ncbi:HAMP domain-containing protein [Paenibacillus sp. LMG 31461]|uniref:HAMP domain-containing protein n=1 Tax=Paenibacillus plantarum TaxID=2654975 RepID=A0ABX1X2K0_9BACL|nr:sensor histidine kinase [Paenibacillus plantarum]NOU62637.1 HAMP domain-containing protein [Paenibacillus plantarum]